MPRKIPATHLGNAARAKKKKPMTKNRIIFENAHDLKRKRKIFFGMNRKLKG